MSLLFMYYKFVILAYILFLLSFLLNIICGKIINKNEEGGFQKRILVWTETNIVCLGCLFDTPLNTCLLTQACLLPSLR